MIPPVYLVSDRSVQCQTKLHGVRTATVEKANTGTLDRCQGSSIFPLYMKQQLSGRRLCSQWRIHSSRPPSRPLRHSRRDVTYTAFHCILIEKVYLYHSLLQAIRDILITGHQQAFVWMDEWFGKYSTYISRARLKGREGTKCRG